MNYIVMWRNKANPNTWNTKRGYSILNACKVLHYLRQSSTVEEAKVKKVSTS
jgi:hypothetical protein